MAKSLQCHSRPRRLGGRLVLIQDHATMRRQRYKTSPATQAFPVRHQDCWFGPLSPKCREGETAFSSHPFC
jgi:hypothetical protein